MNLKEILKLVIDFAKEIIKLNSKLNFHHVSDDKDYTKGPLHIDKTAFGDVIHIGVKFDSSTPVIRAVSRPLDILDCKYFSIGFSCCSHLSSMPLGRGSFFSKSIKFSFFLFLFSSPISCFLFAAFSLANTFSPLAHHSS